MRFSRPAEVTQLGNTKLSKEGGVTVDATCVHFCDAKYGNWSAHCTETSNNMVVVLENLKRLVDDNKFVRTNAKGQKEVLVKIQLEKNKDDSPADYIRRNIDAYLRGEYQGPFEGMDRFWDTNTGDVAKHCWIPVEDIMGNPPMFKLSNWVKGFPKDKLVQGAQIQVLSCVFQAYLRLKKPKGAAVANEKLIQAQAAQAAAAPVAPGEALDAAAGNLAPQSKRVPEVFFGISTNVGVNIRGTYVEGTSALTSFKALAADKRHYMCLPESSQESFCIVQRLEGYQAFVDDCEPGPSVICERMYSVDRKSFIKTTPGQQGAPETHEPILQLSYNICQYKGAPPKLTPGPGAPQELNPEEFPWTLNGFLSGPQLSLTGITRLDDWVKYAPTEWRGVGVFSIQAAETRRSALNQPGQAAAKGWSGQIDTYVRGFFPDMRETLKDQALAVDVAILKTLYSDVYQRLTSTDDDGQKVEVISLHLDKFKGKGRSAPALSMPNLLHLLGNDEIININECEKNIGHLLENSQLYVLPFIPIPQDVIQRIQGDNADNVRVYRREVLAHLRATLGSGDKLIEVLLGFKDAPPMKGRTNLLYTSDEIASLSGMQQALAKDKKKNEILPTVLVGRNLPRDNSVWTKYGQKQPLTNGFDFQLYMVQREPEHDTRVSKQ